jgi:RNAse (barnase) inhibitor barstar
MKQITVDLTTAVSLDDLYDLLLKSLNAPEWHGHNLNALWESIAYQENGLTEPPYELVLSGVGQLSLELQEKLKIICEVFDQARKEEDQKIFYRIES